MLWESECTKVKLAAFWEAFDALQRPAVDVLGILVHSVVLREHLLEEWVEPVKVGWLHGVATHARVCILHARVDASEEGWLLFIAKAVVVFNVKVLAGQVIWVRHFVGFDLGELLGRIDSTSSGWCGITRACFGFFFLEELEAVVQCGDDLCFGDAESGRWRNVACAVLADWRVFAEAQIITALYNGLK